MSPTASRQRTKRGNRTTHAQTAHQPETQPEKEPEMSTTAPAAPAAPAEQTPETPEVVEETTAPEEATAEEGSQELPVAPEDESQAPPEEDTETPEEEPTEEPAAETETPEEETPEEPTAETPQEEVDTETGEITEPEAQAKPLTAAQQRKAAREARTGGDDAELSAVERAKANMAAEQAGEKDKEPEGTPKKAEKKEKAPPAPPKHPTHKVRKNGRDWNVLDEVPPATGVVATEHDWNLATDKETKRNRYQDGGSHVTWWLDKPWCGTQKLDLMHRRSTGICEIWWVENGVNGHRHTIFDVFSDADALRSLEMEVVAGGFVDKDAK